MSNSKANLKVLTVVVFSLLFSPFSFSNNALEVLHFWTSPGEANALNVVKEEIDLQGYQWQDFVVVGGGGEAARASLKKRLFAGNPPAAATLKGLTLKRWASLGYLRTLDEMANNQNWHDRIPKAVAEQVQHRGAFIAAPINIHSSNWMWVNAPVLAKHNLTLPNNWQEFETLLKTLQQLGVTPIVHVDQAWQDATLFESVLLSVAGPDTYRRAFIDLDFNHLRSKTMVEVFDTLAMLKQYTLRLPADASWDQATKQVMDGEAAIQFMGDWAKGEFVRFNKQVGKDYLCALLPGIDQSYIFMVDAFTTFTDKHNRLRGAQNTLVNAVMKDQVQLEFNRNKGSLPAVIGEDYSNEDGCFQTGIRTVTEADKRQQLLPSTAHGLTVSEAIQTELYNVVHKFMSGDDLTSEQAVKLLVRRLKYGSYKL